MVEISAGGIVLDKNKVLLLKRLSSGWVFPKGHVEENEQIYQAAIREVKEETNIDASINSYLGNSLYSYYNDTNDQVSQKIVYWFSMEATSFNPRALKEEGFLDVRFVDIEEAYYLIVHQKERQILSLINI